MGGADEGAGIMVPAGRRASGRAKWKGYHCVVDTVRLGHEQAKPIVDCLCFSAKFSGGWLIETTVPTYGRTMGVTKSADDRGRCGAVRCGAMYYVVGPA